MYLPIAAQLDKLQEKGYGARYATWRAAREELGPGITSRLVAIFRKREGGSTKTRLGTGFLTKFARGRTAHAMSRKNPKTSC